LSACVRCQTALIVVLCQRRGGRVCGSVIVSGRWLVCPAVRPAVTYLSSLPLPPLSAPWWPCVRIYYCFWAMACLSSSASRRDLSLVPAPAPSVSAVVAVCAGAPCLSGRGLFVWQRPAVTYLSSLPLPLPPLLAPWWPCVRIYYCVWAVACLSSRAPRLDLSVVAAPVPSVSAVVAVCADPLLFQGGGLFVQPCAPP
jgi:hypothetical protein